MLSAAGLRINGEKSVTLNPEYSILHKLQSMGHRINPPLHVVSDKLDASKNPEDSVMNPMHSTFPERSERVLEEAFDPYHSMTVIMSDVSGRTMMPTLQAALEKGGNILSFGASTGEEALALKSRFPSAQVSGYEISDKVVKENHARLTAAGIAPYTSNLGDLTPNSFDYIECNFVVFAALSQWDFNDLMTDFSKLLRPSGVLELLVYRKGDISISEFDDSVLSHWLDDRPHMPRLYGRVEHPGAAVAGGVGDLTKMSLLLGVLNNVNGDYTAPETSPSTDDTQKEKKGDKAFAAPRNVVVGTLAYLGVQFLIALS